MAFRHTAPFPPIAPLGLAALLLLSGCEMLGIESMEKLAGRREAEGKAVGSACRHALRAIEDCYTLNPKAVKAAVFGGWREMDEYMRENKLEGIAPTLVKGLPKPEGESGDAADDKPARPAGRGVARERVIKSANAS